MSPLITNRCRTDAALIEVEDLVAKAKITSEGFIEHIEGLSVLELAGLADHDVLQTDGAG